MGFLFVTAIVYNYNMSGQDFEDSLRSIILDVCEALYHNGYRVAPVGAIMRLIGVPEEKACLHDDDYFELDHEFAAELAARKGLVDLAVPPGTVIH